MKISSNLETFQNAYLISNSSNRKDPFDLDIKINRAAIDEKISNQLITSKSLCTPGCGNTGSGNSFCC
ncbi:MAG: Gallidermin [Chlamydiales bacterium]|jgi:gallidermin/nisin family lantibiotic|nr:Gallidermin [Chlamydiales bacterium]